MISFGFSLVPIRKSELVYIFPARETIIQPDAQSMPTDKKENQRDACPEMAPTAPQVDEVKGRRLQNMANGEPKWSTA